MCFGPSLIPLLPNFPPGDSINGGLVALDAESRPHFASLNQTQFPGVKNTWHETFINYLDLSIGRKLRTGIYEAKCSLFGDDIVVAKFARFDWEIQYIEDETTAYQWISGHTTTTPAPVAPKFLGHLTENGRVIGFLMERITDARHAGTQDLQACREVLSRLRNVRIESCFCQSWIVQELVSKIRRAEETEVFSKKKKKKGIFLVNYCYLDQNSIQREPWERMGRSKVQIVDRPGGVE